MHGSINVKSHNNSSKWQMGFNSASKGLIISPSETNSLWITPCQSKKITNLVFTRDFWNFNFFRSWRVFSDPCSGLTFSGRIVGKTPADYFFVPKSEIPLKYTSLWLDFGHPESRDMYIIHNCKWRLLKGHPEAVWPWKSVCTVRKDVCQKLNNKNAHHQELF
jgi:hypothetical protein